MIYLYFDGACLPSNPGGCATYGWVAYREEGDPIAHGCGVDRAGEEATNNIGEWAACVKALEWLVAHSPEEPTILRGDSQLIIRQLQGQYKVKNPTLVLYWQQAQMLMTKLRQPLKCEWIRREQNAVADSLTKRAYERYLEKQYDK